MYEVSSKGFSTTGFAEIKKMALSQNVLWNIKALLNSLAFISNSKHHFSTSEIILQHSQKFILYFLNNVIITCSTIYRVSIAINKVTITVKYTQLLFDILQFYKTEFNLVAHLILIYFYEHRC